MQPLTVVHIIARQEQTTATVPVLTTTIEFEGRGCSVPVCCAMPGCCTGAATGAAAGAATGAAAAAAGALAVATAGAAAGGAAAGDRDWLGGSDWLCS